MMGFIAARLQYLRYLSIGIFCAAFNLFIQVVSVAIFDFHYMAANSLSFFILVPLSYVLHRNITFCGGRETWGKGFAKYAVQWIGLFLVNISLLALLIDAVNLNAIISIVFVTVLLHMLGFLGLRFYVFDISEKSGYS